MPSHQRNHTAVIRWLLFACLLSSGSSLEAQVEAPTPVPTQKAPSTSKETSDDSELKIHNYQLKHAKAIEVLKLFKQLHGGENTATVDERTNSIVFLANETNAGELRESLALLDGDALPSIIPPTPVVQGSSPKVPRPAKTKPAGPFRKFTFKHAKVADVVKILRELTGANIDNENVDGFAVDERTNSVIWKVNDKWESQHWEETLVALDGESSESKFQSAPSPYAPPASMPTPMNFTPTPNTQVSAQPTQTFTFSMGFERGESVESLKQRYNELEQKAHLLADNLKQSTSLSESQRAELQLAVRKSFEARQALQRAELADLAGRMKSMQQSIDMRDRLADQVVQRRVEDLLNPNWKWDATQISNNSTPSIRKGNSGSQVTIRTAKEMQALLQGTWDVGTFQADDQGDVRITQAVIRGELLLLNTMQSGKVLGVSPWKLVWPDSDKPFEVEVIWDPNSNHQPTLGMPGRIAYDGKRFQLAFGEKRPNEICPGENITYIDCVRANIEDRSTAAQATYQFGSQVRTNSSATGLTKSDANRQSVGQAIKELVSQLPIQTPPFGIVVSDIDVTAKEELGDFKEVIQEQITAELKTFAHLYVISRRSAEAAIHSAGVKWTDVVIPDRRAKYVDELKKEGHAVDLILFVKLVGTENPTEYLLALELMDRGGRSHKCSATISLPETSTRFMKQRVQGNWIVESLSAEGKDGLLDQKSPLVLSIDGETLSLLDAAATPLDMQWRGLSESSKDDQPIFAVDFVLDPNGKRVTAPGILSCDGEVLRICYCTSEFDNLVNDAFRPDRFLAGTKVNLFTCRRATTSTVTNTTGDADLSTPQATLDTIHRYSVDHPMAVPVECYTEAALQELNGVMLQQLCFMSGLSQVGLQTGGVIGVKDNAPIVAGTAPSFHLRVDALIKEHSLPTPPEECTKAFELLAKLTLGAAFDSDESLVKPDRELFRLAAGILKSPQEFLPKAGELSERFNNIPGDTESPRKESKAQPKYLIKIDGDQATATQIVDSDKPSVPMSFKLQRINQRWLVSEAFSDEILNQMISSMSQVLGAMSAIESEVANQRNSSDSKKAPDAESTNNASPREWEDFVKLLPESGTALVMFSYEPAIKEQMLPVAKKVAEAASAELIELPLTQWRKILSPEATHFVLMKDRQLVGIRTGLMTEARLQDFVDKAKDWLTPRSTGIEENSLVRIDCFINSGPNNIGSQHGGAHPITLAVVAVHEDQALLFGSESIAEYIEKGYACVAIVRDATGKPKQLPLDVVLNGPIKLLGRSEKQPKSAASMKVTLGDGTVSEVPLPGIENIYPKSVTETRDEYDVGSAIYHLRGVHGLAPVKLAAIDDAPKIAQRVLSGSFTREHHSPPLHGFRSPIHWQSQTVSMAGGHIYGDNINGAEMFEVLCPTLPAPCGFTFNEHGHLVGKYGLGSPSEKDTTHTVFKPDATHSVLLAALEKIDAPGLRTALAQTLEESHESLKTSARESAAIDEADKPLYSGHPISWWLDTYWVNATANPKTTENAAQEYVASEAIRKLRELPECKAAIEAALEKWFESVEHEVNEGQLTRAAKCIVFAAGPENQKLAVDYLFEIAKRVPINPGEEDLGKWIDCWDDEMDKALEELVFNDELATQIADRLKTGNSAQRRFAVTFLLNRGASKQPNTPDQTEANAWFRSHDKLFYPAFEAALQDSSEAVRMFAVIVLTGIDPLNSLLPFQLKTAVESDPSTQVRCVAIQLLCSKELASTIEAQSVELQPLLMKALEADSSVDVRYAALGALMAIDNDSELVHKTLMEWARCKDCLQVEHALSLMLRNHEAGDRPQSIDELIELLSDPEWGTKVEVNYNNWSTHHRWARQYAIAILGQYAAHAHRAIPTLEAEVARNNKDTLSFTTAALDSARGYCPDLPIDKLQGEWEFVSMQKPEVSSPFFDFQTSSDQQPSAVITISGTQLKLGNQVLAEFSHYRSGSRQGVALLLDPDGKKRHCHGGYNFKGGPSPEYKPNVAPAPELLILEVSELHNEPNATQATKQIYEFRRVKK